MDRNGTASIVGMCIRRSLNLIHAQWFYTLHYNRSDIFKGEATHEGPKDLKETVGMALKVATLPLLGIVSQGIKTNEPACTKLREHHTRTFSYSAIPTSFFTCKY